MRVGIATAGAKGVWFLEAFCKSQRPSVVVAYEQKGDASRAFEAIHRLCAENAIALQPRAEMATSLAGCDLSFYVGWQYMVDAPAPGAIVIHDSLLPRYRGFAPTVTALIKGEACIGVSAIRPVAEVDSGPILKQKDVAISYPIRLADALRRQSEAAAQLACDILEAWPNITEQPQDDSTATYSIWRDRDDSWIDWRAPAPDIARFVDAVGWPYHGALTLHQDREVVILAATPLPDVRFEIRQPGKIWQLAGSAPVVVCGQGLLRIDEAHYADGSALTDMRIRGRFSSAWAHR